LLNVRKSQRGKIIIGRAGVGKSLLLESLQGSLNEQVSSKQKQRNLFKKELTGSRSYSRNISYQNSPIANERSPIF